MIQDRDKLFYTVRDLAERAGVTETRIRQLLLDGRDLQGEKVGQNWIIRPDVARRWLESRGR